MKIYVLCALVALTACSRVAFRSVGGSTPSTPVPTVTPAPTPDDEDNDDEARCHKFKKDLFKCDKSCYTIEDKTFIEVSCKRNNGHSND
jgi:hypothetical protein